MRARFEPLGLRILFIALVLALLGEIVWFPVWSVEPGRYSMRILLGFVADPSLAFVLERLAPAAAVLGLVGAAVIEVARRRASLDGGKRLTRERVALVLAIAAEAAVLGSIGLFMSVGLNVFLISAATGVVVIIALNLYLLWTAGREAGWFIRVMGLTAFAAALVSGALGVAGSAQIWTPNSQYWALMSSLDVARWFLGEASVVLWVVAYVGVLVRKPELASRAPSVA